MTPWTVLVHSRSRVSGSSEPISCGKSIWWFLRAAITMSYARASCIALRHVHPLTALGAGQHGVAHLLGFQRFTERRRGGLFFRQAVEEIGHMMDERVFVADREARHPP